MKRWLSAVTVKPVRVKPVTVSLVTLVVTSALTSVLMIAAGHAAAAQDPWVGVRGGLSIPRLSSGGNEVSSGYSSRLAPDFGVVAGYGLSDHFAIVGEVHYAGQGGKREGLQAINQSPEGLPPLEPGQYLYGDFKDESILNYLEIPLMGMYRWTPSEKWRCFAEGGPFIGFLLNATEKTRGTSLIYVDRNRTPLTVEGQPLPPASFDKDTNVKSDLNEVNWGVTAGVGVAYRVRGRHEIFFDVRGEYGLDNVQKNTERDGESNTGNAVFSAGYTYTFGSHL